MIIDDAIATCDTVIADLNAMLAPAPVPTGALLLDSIVNKSAWKTHYSLGNAGVSDAITSAWNGAAFDYETGTMHVVCSGGHGDSWNNQCYAWRGGWKLTKDQTPFPPDLLVPGYSPVNRFAQSIPCAGNGFDQMGTYPVSPWVSGAQVYYDGSPCSRHVYGGTVWLPKQKRVMLIAGACWPGGASDFYVGWFDPLTGMWERKGNAPRVDPGQNLCYDTVRDRVIYNAVGTQFVYSYDPATDTHTRIGPTNTDPLSGGIGGPFTRLCVAGDYVYLTLKGGFTLPAYVNCIVRMRLGQASLQAWRPIPVTGDTTGLYSVCPGMEYDPDRNALVFWSFNDPGNVSILSLTDFSISKQAHGQTIDTTGTQTGVWGRFRRKAKDTYVLFVKSTLPVYVLKLNP